MTEKDFRKIVTQLEFTKEDKDNIASFMNSLESKLKELNNEYYEIDHLEKAMNYSFGTFSHEDKNLELLVVIKSKTNKSFPLLNQAALNALWNFSLFYFNVDKTSQIQISTQINSVYVQTKDYNLNLLVRFSDELDYQTDFYMNQEALKNTFVNVAQSEFNLFKNCVQLIKYYRDLNNVNIPTYNLILLLYYGLSENFTTHTYEAYLRELVHAIDDFLKGIKIDQDDETYRKLNLERPNVSKKPYMIMDIANPSSNLTNGVGEGTLAEYRKMKKVIQKLFDLK